MTTIHGPLPRKEGAVESPDLQARLPYALRALRHKNFRLFVTGQMVSLIGTWMQSVAQSWLVYRLTDSSFLLGLTGFLSHIPIFLLAPLAGTVADRHDRRRILIRTQAVSMLLAALLAVLTFSDLVRIEHIFLLTLLGGVANAFDVPARQSFAIEMVGRQDLMNAIALNSSMVNLARIAGPAIAGILVAQVGEAWCFAINAISYMAVLSGLWRMNIRGRARAEATTSALGHISEGFRFVANTRPISALLLLLGLISLVGLPYTILMPAFADRVLKQDAGGFGLLMGASGAGALAGALMLTGRRKTSGLGSWVAYSGAAFGLSLILFSVSRSFWPAIFFLLVAGFSNMVGMAASNTLIQSMVPDGLRGRVMALYTMMFLGMAPFGALLGGVLAEQLGVPMTIGMGGLGCLAGAALFWYRLPSLRGEGRRLILAQQMAAGEPAEEMTASGMPQ